MDRSRLCAHRSYLSDFIKINLRPSLIDSAEIKRLYLEKDFSAAQFGEKLGVSKQMILSRLRAVGIHHAVRKGRAPDNYRYTEPPFGLRIRDGRLVADNREMRLVRTIVELRERKKLRWAQIVDYLNSTGYRTRRGKVWSRVGIKRIHSRWFGKI